MGLKYCIRDHRKVFAVTLVWMIPIIDTRAPVKKLTVRTVKAPWIDEELNNCMKKTWLIRKRHG
jgi:hypothetical protein